MRLYISLTVSDDLVPKYPCSALFYVSLLAGLKLYSRRTFPLLRW